MKITHILKISSIYSVISVPSVAKIIHDYYKNGD